MIKNILKMSSLAVVTVAAQSLVPLVAQAETTSLSDGVMCVAKGTVSGKRIWFQTSVIDDATMKTNGTPVTVLITEAKTTGPASETMVAGKGTTTYLGDNRYSGKTETDTPLSFSLSSNYSHIALRHGDDLFAGVCH
jgi:hypothetical protein